MIYQLCARRTLHYLIPFSSLLHNDYEINTSVSARRHLGHQWAMSPDWDCHCDCEWLLVLGLVIFLRAEINQLHVLCPVAIPRCIVVVFIVTFLSLEFLIYGASFIVKSYISSSAARLSSYPRLSKLGYGRKKEEQNRNKRNTSSLTYLAKESQ